MLLNRVSFLPIRILAKESLLYDCIMICNPQATVDWFRIYKMPTGKPPNQFAFNAEAKDKVYDKTTIKTLTLHSWEWSMSKFLCILTRNMTSHSKENLAFHSLLRWKMILIQILTTLCIFSLEGWENVLFELRSERVNSLMSIKDKTAMYSLAIWCTPHSFSVL